MTESESSYDTSGCKNVFVQEVIAAFAQITPEMKVRDLEQPAHGSLRREEKRVTTTQSACLRDQGRIVLLCKALRNEDLRPASASQVDLSGIAGSSLMQRRSANRLKHSPN